MLKRSSKKQRAGLVFPVGKVHRRLKEGKYAKRIGDTASIYLSAVMEYLVAELLEISGDVKNRESKNIRKRITPRDILTSVKEDYDFDILLKDVTIANGGTVSTINIVPAAPKVKGKGIGKGKEGKENGKSAKASNNPHSTASHKTLPLEVPALKRKESLSREEREISHLVTLGVKHLPKGQTIKVVSGNIVDIEADAIIHPTDARLSLAGMVGSSIREQGGRRFEEEVAECAHKHGMLNVSDAVMTKAHNLKTSHVIHTHSPKWSNQNNIQLLETAIKNILTLADGKDLKSIALPSIGSGNNGFPKHVAAQSILRAINEYYQDAFESSVKEVYFVLFDEESVIVYQHELKNMIN